MPAKKKPAPPEPPVDLDSELDWPRIIYDVVVEFGQPVTSPEIAALTELALDRVATLLDELVSKGELTLGDDQFYRLPSGPSVEEKFVAAAEDHGEITIEMGYDDTIATPSPVPTANLEGPTTTVYLPNSDIVAFLKHINLPPHLLAGFGIPAQVNGFLSFEDAVPTAEDPRPTRAFRVVLYGQHMKVAPGLNPNQPGYESQIQRSIISPDPDAAVES